MPVVCGIRVGGIPNMAECHIPSFFVDLGSEPSENTLQATHSPNKKTELQENSSRKVKYLKVFYHLENHEGGRGTSCDKHLTGVWVFNPLEISFALCQSSSAQCTLDWLFYLC